METLQEMGIKDLEHVVLKAKTSSEFYGRYYEAGEPILYFENIQIAQLSENTNLRMAQGGFLNQPLVVWEDRQNTMFQFSNGTLNKISLNMLLEANMITENKINAPFKEKVEIDMNGKAYLSYIPTKERKVFCYTYTVGNMQKKISNFSISEDGCLTVGDKYYGQTVLVDYYFNPKSTATLYTMSRERTANLYTLEATFYLKDENEGLFHTGILEMPKVYIMSNINLRMGERADPAVGTFRIVAMPENNDGYESMVYKLTYLDQDIYGI